MQYMSILGCSKPVSRIIKGTDYFYLDSYALHKEQLNQYVSCGGNIIDSAHIYAGGESEAVIGRYLEESDNRDQLLILTKGGISSLQPKILHEEIMMSLERLRRDTIELYALHRDDASLTVGEIIEQLNKYIDAGTIGAIGASNWTPQRIVEANQYAKEHGLTGFTFNSPNLSLAKPQEPFWSGVLHMDDEMESMHQHLRLPCLAWSPLARGFLSGRFTRDAVSDHDIARVYYNDDNWGRYDRAAELAREKGVTLVEIALAYVANQSYPTAIIAGARSLEELQSCIVAVELKLTEQEVAWLDKG